MQCSAEVDLLTFGNVVSEGKKRRKGIEKQMIMNGFKANRKWNRPPVSINFEVPFAPSGFKVHFIFEKLKKMM